MIVSLRCVVWVLVWGWVQGQGCIDVVPEWSWYSCPQQKEFGKCDEWFVKSGNYCMKSCGRCDDDNIENQPTGCTDVPPNGWYTCEQQKEFGKCEQYFMKSNNYCDRTCGRCSDSNANTSNDLSLDTQACYDNPPDYWWETCEQQKEFGKCRDQWMKEGQYCDKTCGFCTDVDELTSQKVESETAEMGSQELEECYDKVPDYMWETCEQQKEYGKCEEWWMKSGSYCDLTCGRCTASNNDTTPLQSNGAIEELKAIQQETAKYEYTYDIENGASTSQNILSVNGYYNGDEQVNNDNYKGPFTDERVKQIEADLEQCQNELWSDSSQAASITSFVRTEGTQFVKDGQTFPFVGFNFHDLMKIAANESTKYRVELAFQKAKEMNLKVCRIFAFTDGDNWQPEFFDMIRGTQFWQEPKALQSAPGVYEEDMFQALDYVIHMASQYDIMLLPVMTNYWPGYGGAQQYIKWIHNTDTTLGHTIDEFFSDYLPRMLLKRFMCELVRRTNTYSGVRYRDDPTIFAWSLINEGRCPECDANEPKDQTLYNWMNDMSSFLKSIDDNHMISAGTEGFFGNSAPEYLIYNPGGWPGCEGTDFMRQHQIPNIDFATIRMYDRLKSWDYDNNRECDQYCFVKWAEQSTRGHLKAAAQLNMPLVIEEFGELVAEEQHKNERNHLLHLVLQLVFESALQGGPGMGAMFWQAGVSGQVDWDNYTIYLDSAPKIATPLYTLDFITEEEAAFRHESAQLACYPSQDVSWEANYYANRHQIDLEPLRIPQGIKEKSDLEIIKMHASNFAALRTSTQL